MSDGYERWLIAKGNAFHPGAGAVVKLIDRLKAEKFLPGPDEVAKLSYKGMRAERAKSTGGYAAMTVDNEFGDDVAKKIAASVRALPSTVDVDFIDAPEREELRLVWPIEGPGLKYPLTHDASPSYALEIHRAPDYVVPIAENIPSIPTICACGEDLAFEWDDEELVPAFGASTGIFAECEDCSRTFDPPAKGTVQVANAFDGTLEELRGGAAYRFALKIDAKAFARDPKLTFAPELVAIVEEIFGRSFFQVGALY